MISVVLPLESHHWFIPVLFSFLSWSHEEAVLTLRGNSNSTKFACPLVSVGVPSKGSWEEVLAADKKLVGSLRFLCVDCSSS